jgi:hypothetical protein
MPSIWWPGGWSLVIGLVVCGCADIAGFDGNPQMNPGQDCLSCHSAGGQASGLTFSVGGTVYPQALAGAEGGLFDAEIDITDLGGRHFTLRSNGAGNFYSAEAIVFPATVAVTVGGQTLSMEKQSPTGQCNACHGVLTNADNTLRPLPLPPFGEDGGLGIAPGSIYGFPQTACPTPISDACPSPAPSYQNQIKAVIQANCLPCHQPGQNLPSLDSHADIAAVPNNKTQVAGCLMPTLDSPGLPWFPMSPDERALLIGWLNCGSPDN